MPTLRSTQKEMGMHSPKQSARHHDRRVTEECTRGLVPPHPACQFVDEAGRGRESREQERGEAGSLVIVDVAPEIGGDTNWRIIK